MEVDFNNDKDQEMAVDEICENSENRPQQIEDIISYLVRNDKVVFKSQQRGEAEPDNTEKSQIALDTYDKSKTLFLLRFGKFLTIGQLDFFKQQADCDQELDLVIKGLYSNALSTQKQVKNRRFEKLKMLIEENSYFSEMEMMKRNPLLYEQLVGQYLSEEEKRERDKVNRQNLSFVSILMEGIERDAAACKQKEQEDEERQEESDMDEDSSKSDSIGGPSQMNADGSTSKCPQWGEIPVKTQWGEYTDNEPSSSKVISKLESFDKRNFESNKCPAPKWREFYNSMVREGVRKRIQPSSLITAEERTLLRNEFTTLMYQSFLDGEDDFDYDTVDNDDSYDNLDIVNHDEEDKYFDSEEPEVIADDMDGKVQQESSEDELDIYMSALNQHPAVSQLSKDIQKL